MEKYKYGRYVKYVPPKIEECTFGDHAFLYARDNDVSQYHLMREAWKEFEAWADNIVKEHEAEPESAQVKIGRELVKWSRQQDSFALYVLIRMHWKTFRDNFLLPDTPQIVLDIVDALLKGKMTEEERNVP